MPFRLRTIVHAADGREIVRDRDLPADAIGIGRSADNAVHLPDLAVEPFHARVVRQADGGLRIESAGTLGFGIDGRTVHQADVDPEAGAELRFGGYRLMLSIDEDDIPLIIIRQAEEDDAASPDKADFTIAGLMPGKRVLSWGLALAVLIAFLAVPVIGNLLRQPGPVSSVAAPDRVPGDAGWSPGRLSLAHHGLENNCTACHVRPFEAVRDEACLTCHKAVHEHAAPDRLALARGEPALGVRLLWSVAHAFGKPGPGACSDCHTEHEGAGRMVPAGQQFCADCHATLDQRLRDTGIGNAGDFGTLHPRFRPAIPLTVGSGKLTRVSMDANPREASGLHFPHRLHLDARGGVARMAATIGGAKGYGAGGLGCLDCHRKTADGVRFEPIRMERDCGSCHSLAYDRVGGIVRRLRHGDVNQMIADLALRPVVANPIVTGRGRPGAFGDGGIYHADFRGPGTGSSLAYRALSRDGICGECHVADLSGGRFDVMPVTQVARYMTNGWFDHRDHGQQNCTSCHAAERSSASSDVLLPDIDTCRICHRGEKAGGAIVPSGCAMCHSYHVSLQAPRTGATGKP